MTFHGWVAGIVVDSPRFAARVRGFMARWGLAMKRIAVLLLALAAQDCLRLSAPASEAKADVLTSEERAALLLYAKDTWRSFEELTWPSGLPADCVYHEGAGWARRLSNTTPTNIAAYLWSVVAAERLHLISPAEARSRLGQTLTTLASVKRTHGFFPNELDPRSGAVLRLFPVDNQPRHLRLSAVDNAWLATALLIVANTEPSLRANAGRLLQPMDFRFFYDDYRAADPVKHPGQLHVGYRPDEKVFYGHYGMLNTEARIINYLGVALGQLPPEAYYRMFRTLPETLGPQGQSPRGKICDYNGVKVFEGSYTYHGMRILPSWGGSMFEALMVPLFVPEEAWAPRSWGRNHRLYVQAQIEHGLHEAAYGFWGFSPAAKPAGGYDVYGVKALGTYSRGYYSNGIVPAATADAAAASPKTQWTHGVVTPHASFLALRYAPHEAISNLRLLSQKFPTIYGPLGFQDSVDVTAGAVSSCILTLDQGMIMAAVANALADDAMRHAFSDGRIETAVRPLIAAEEFAAGPPEQELAVHPAESAAATGVDGK
jgi:hypothetical protein